MSAALAQMAGHVEADTLRLGARAYGPDDFAPDDFASVSALRITSDFLNAPELRIPMSCEPSTLASHGFDRVLRFFGLAG